MKYRVYLQRNIERNNRMNYGLTMKEIRDASRFQYERDMRMISGYYGW